MNMKSLFAILALALGLGWTGSAFAQEEHYGARPWELNLHGSAHMLDEAEDTDVGAGARILMHMPSGLGFGGSFEWIASNVDLGEDDFDVTTYLYSGSVEYTFGANSTLHPFVNAGVGAATVKISDVPEGFDDSETNLLIPIGGGVKWFPRTDASWAIRAEVRDNIIRVSGDDDELEDSDSEMFHNWEISGGVSFFFGG